MAKRRVWTDYTLYTPSYRKDHGLCLDFKTLERAKQYARGAGPGTLIVRNFNIVGLEGDFDWWQDGRCWYFGDHRFRRLPSAEENKWIVTTQQLRSTGLLRKKRRLTKAAGTDILRRLRHLPGDAIEPR